MATGRKTGGRKAGKPNVVTGDLRYAFKVLVEGNIGKFQNWIDRVAEKDPVRAMQLLVDVAEFCIPKLQRKVDEDGNDAVTKIIITKVEDAKETKGQD